MVIVILLTAGLSITVLSSLSSSTPDYIPTSDSSQRHKQLDPDTAVLNLETGFRAPKVEGVHLTSDLESESLWERNRQYAIVIDAGSSGSRVQVYSWTNPAFARKALGQNAMNRLPVIEKGDEKGERWTFKEDPGISSFASRPEAIGSHLQPLLDFSDSVIPKRKRAQTPLYLLATAGMRLVEPTARDRLLDRTCQYIRSHSPYRLDGGCALHVRVISGELEGIYGWVTVNYLKNGFDVANDPNTPKKHTFGFLDMGGASTQIAFQPTRDMAERHSDDLTTMKLRFLDGVEMTYRVFVTTFLGFGVNEARRRYLEGLTAADSSHTDTTNLPIPEPCLPTGLLYKDPHLASTTPTPTFLGTGSFTQCLTSLLPLLNKSLPCPDRPCLFNGVHAPVSNALHFLGVSEYWYTASDVYGLGGSYNHSLFLDSTTKFCSQPWPEIQQHFGEKRWPMVNDIDRLKLQCFKSAWIMSVLHDGLGVPREMVRVPNDEDDSGRGVDVHGEGASSDPAFESVNEIGTFSVSWTLGAILLHVAATIPRADGEAQGVVGRVVKWVLGMVLMGGVGGGLLWQWRKRKRLTRKYSDVAQVDPDGVGRIEIVYERPR
ncbi:nucleoside phosphatase family-domain-containing protein [Fimicolochytrium jonesii]|uniref:nucleoside phosphatase family-domain-containing protein n=1 Tax=Fimicolochytrium jonesii TaxID=1396493 RepID=UPI0022FE0498|nr:nucleoside phosphatase family-domain-containing protein [Fimicolochytrium jonesii]KAI8826528.1 nucleoside phosphatase family-domain-containing protein [Fimicolochytrium jonesii]